MSREQKFKKGTGIGGKDNEFEHTEFEEFM